MASGSTYQVVDGGLNAGATVYIDRGYAFTSVPSSVAGTTYIVTANNDKQANQANFLSFWVDQDVTVFVAYDSRASSLPNWLASWTDTGEILGTSDV
ncbi:MAG: hypothetical protein IIB31_08350, partial [Chloroflexi bacterium]|nr:hypothetical protein [Chloroflexota bacterium]